MVEFDVLPRQMRGKGCTVYIQAPILCDADAIAKACQEGLERVAEAIQGDVATNRDMIFADAPEDSHFPSGKYPDAASYYGSGKIPTYSGWLLASFTDMGETAPTERSLSFTASYAGQVQEGGGIGEVPREWAMEKLDKENEEDIVVYSTKPHPFIEALCQKLTDNLTNYDYLSIFETHFLASIK